MKVLRGLLVAVALLAALLAAGLGIVWIRTAPGVLPEGSESAARLAPGPHPVGKVEFEWMDASRPTAANGDHPGAPERADHEEFLVRVLPAELPEVTYTASRR